MVCCRSVYGYGETPGQALLYVRINQICLDEGVKDNTISKKTKILQVRSDIHELNGYGMVIMALHSASRYYRFQQDTLNGLVGRKFTESEYKYYSILIKAIGRKEFMKILKVYFAEDSEWCLCVHKEHYIFEIIY
jgi:hypothetical protein